MVERDFSKLTDDQILDEIFADEELLDMFLNAKEHKTLHNTDRADGRQLSRKLGKGKNYADTSLRISIGKMRKVLPDYVYWSFGKQYNRKEGKVERIRIDR